MCIKPLLVPFRERRDKEITNYITNITGWIV